MNVEENRTVIPSYTEHITVYFCAVGDERTGGEESGVTIRAEHMSSHGIQLPINRETSKFFRPHAADAMIT